MSAQAISFQILNWLVQWVGTAVQVTSMAFGILSKMSSQEV
jgi:hypothetical protein